MEGYIKRCFDGDEVNAAYRRAIGLAEKEYTVNPNNTNILINLASLYQKLGQPTQARSSLERALAIQPDDVDLMFRASYTYEALGERDRALELLDKALENGYPLADVERTTSLDSLRTDPRYEQLRRRAASSP